jgi:predicted extracellular nuclease
MRAAGAVAALVLGAAAAGAEPSIAARADGASFTAIRAIQGHGARSPLEGALVITRGAVTRVDSNGFFLQVADGDGDGDGRASRGLFVFTDAVPEVQAGACVSVSGRVVEFDAGAPGNAETAAHTVTELHAASAPQALAGPCAVTPVELTLPLAPGDSLERLEGMLVTLHGPLTVQQNFFLARYGQLTLATGGRVLAPTNRLPPGPAAQALARADARRAIVLDDGSARQNPSPVPFVADDGTLRAGDTVSEVTGVIDYGLASTSAAGHGAWKIHSVQAPHFVRANPRNAAPAAVGGTLKVAAANVDNFFSTVNDGAHVCAPRQVAADCRGARSEAAFERQRAKLVEALAAIDADVVALMEIENNGAVALQSLVDALNARIGAASWAIVADPPEGTGGDAIKVALIYRPARVRPLGRARGDRDPVHNRSPLAQAFETVADGARLNLIVSHFKSRRCDGAAGPELDRHDLQGCFSHRRLLQARALARFAAQVARRSDVADTLLVGDFNAYAQEDPVRALVAHGFADQVARFDPDGYSYVFDGAAGRLDQVLASAGLTAKVTGVTEWHISADEPTLADDASTPPTPWRASDHDPVVIGLALGVCGRPATMRPCR